MKTANSLQVIKAATPLEKKEQIAIRNRLKFLLGKDGIVSMCLDFENLYVEYNPNMYSVEKLKSRLREVGFPMGYPSKQAS